MFYFVCQLEHSSSNNEKLSVFKDLNKNVIYFYFFCTFYYYDNYEPLQCIYTIIIIYYNKCVK